MAKTTNSNQPSPVTRAKYFVKFVADRVRSKGAKTWNAFQNLKASDILDEGLFTELFAVDKEFGDAIKVPLTTKLQNLISERAAFYAENAPKIGEDGVPHYSAEWIKESQRLNNEIAQTEKAIEAAKKRAAEKAEEEAESQTAEASA